jgi:hypothetical protein
MYSSQTAWNGLPSTWMCRQISTGRASPRKTKSWMSLESGGPSLAFGLSAASSPQDASAAARAKTGILTFL